MTVRGQMGMAGVERRGRARRLVLPDAHAVEDGAEVLAALLMPFPEERSRQHRLHRPLAGGPRTAGYPDKM